MAKSGWMGLITDYGLPWVAGSGHRNIEIACPWCNDGSMKLGLSLEDTRFGCWKHKKAHGGANPVRLIIALLGLSEEKAKSVSDSYFDYYYSTFTASKLAKEAPIADMPTAFLEFSGQMHELRFMQYIANRGLDPSFVIPRFKLRTCPIDYYYSDMLIVPVYENKNLYTWLGRTIDENARPNKRFRAGNSPQTENKLTDYLHDIDNLNGGKILTVVEGVFDSMAITQAFIPGVHATCTFGKHVSDCQFVKLIQLASKYDMVAFGYDATAIDTALEFRNQFKWYVQKPVFTVMPTQKDWAVMDKNEIRGVFQDAKFA